MQAALYEWVRVLLICTVCMQLILQFICEESYRRYVRLFLSLIFLVCAFQPLLGLTGITEKLDTGLKDWLAGWEYEDLADTRLYEKQEDTVLKQAVYTKLEEDTGQLLKEENLQLVSFDCSLLLEKDRAEIKDMTIVADVVEGKEKLSSREEKDRKESILNRLQDRYELSENRISFRIRQ